ncbi:amino acid permease [Mycoplasmopsis phocirhinis]|uniref:amino acid permease n=1 Tax=Mycoplasmopsis phocirhinis TaxID=142650 RepID=UPI001E38DA17|nr:amino acid permease [Mycoplasmopsis phocirhinis]
MPIYTIQVLQDGIGAITNQQALTFGTNYDWIIWLLITTLMGLYLLLVPGLISRIGNIHNTIVLGIKFIPLVFIIIVGFILAFSTKGGISTVKITTFNTNYSIKLGDSFIQYSASAGFIGVFLSIGAIFFAYDGFYIAAGMQSEMKKPEKTTLALSLGLIIITILYIAIAIAMSINGGSFSNMRIYIQNLFGLKAGRIIFGLINIAIAIGVFGVINAFSMWMPRFIETLIAKGEMPLWNKFIHQLNPKKPIVGVIYSIIIGLGANIIFTIIGSLLYIPTNSDYLKYSNDAFHYMARLYSFADLIANWITVFSFVFIALAVMGAIKNRKTNKIKIKNQKKYFLFFAYITVIFTGLAMLAQILVPIVDLFTTFSFDAQYYSIIKNVSLQSAKQEYISLVVGRSMLVVVLLLFHILVFAVAPIENKVHQKRYGSIEKYNQYRQNILLKYN